MCTTLILLVVYLLHSYNVPSSGGRLTVTGSHAPGSLFQVGETLVQYTATDAAGNSRTCNLTVAVQGITPSDKRCFVKYSSEVLYCATNFFSVPTGTECEQPYVPVNGEFICSEEDEGVNCTLHCKEGYSFTHDAAHSYFCAYDGVWEPPYSADRPDCSGKCCTAILSVLVSNSQLRTAAALSYFLVFYLVHICTLLFYCVVNMGSGCLR